MAVGIPQLRGLTVISVFVSRFFFFVFPLLLLVGTLTAEDGATLKGRLVVPARYAESLKPNEIEVTLLEQVQAEDPPVPENWSNLSAEQQDKWLAEFEASEAGKKYIEEQEARIAAARKLVLTLEPDGKFVLYDVPAAIYSLSGKTEKEIAGRKYVCEVFGQLEVLPAAQEIILGDLEVVVSPIFKAGDEAPNLQLEAIDGQKFELKSYNGKYLLINFWSAASPPAANFQKNLQKIVGELPKDQPVELLAISIDPQKNVVEEFIKANGQVGRAVVLGGWNHPAVEEFGLHAVPALWLVDPQGKFLATDTDLGTALRDSGLTLAEVLTAKLQGKEIPKKEPAAESGDSK